MKKLLKVVAGIAIGAASQLMGAQLSITDVQTRGETVIVRWTLTDDTGQNPKNDSGEFSNDQAAIDAALKKALLSYDFAGAVKQTYLGKVASLDNKGTVVLVDKGAAPAPPTPPPSVEVLGLSVGTVSGAQNATVSLPISLAVAQASVAALQFDLALPAGISFVSATPSSGALGAGKSVSANMVNATTLRVLVFGLNQTVIPSGTLLTLQMKIASGMKSGDNPITVSGVVMSDPAGKTVSGDIDTDGDITVG